MGVLNNYTERVKYGTIAGYVMFAFVPVSTGVAILGYLYDAPVWHWIGAAIAVVLVATYVMLLLGVKEVAEQVEDAKLASNLQILIILSVATFPLFALNAPLGTISGFAGQVAGILSLVMLIALGLIALRLAKDFRRAQEVLGSTSKHAARWHAISGYLMVSILLSPIGLLLSLVADFFMLKLLYERSKVPVTVTVQQSQPIALRPLVTALVAGTGLVVGLGALAATYPTGGHVYPSYGWFTSNVSGSPDLDPSTDYVLVAWGEYTGGNDTWLTYDSGSSNQGHYDSQSYGASFPDPLNPSHENRKYSVYVTYTEASGNGAPSAPSALLTEGQTNPTDISDPTPEFSAIYNDQDSGDSAVYYQLQVSTSSSDWTSPYWNSTKTSIATTTEGNRSPDITYGGSTLASSTTYYWRIKFWDDDDAEGAWSTTTSSFSLAAGSSNATPTAPSALLTEGQTNPTNVTDPTPEFSAIYNDPDSGDTAANYQIQVSTSSSDWTSPYWNSGKSGMASTTAGNRSSDISYGGSALASSFSWAA